MARGIAPSPYIGLRYCLQVRRLSKLRVAMQNQNVNG